MMGIVARMLESRSRFGWLTNLADPARWAIDWAAGRPTVTGHVVNERTALECLDVFIPIRAISEDLAKQPLITFERTAQGRRRASEHSNYRMLKINWNPQMTSVVARRTVQAHVLGWGNGYAEIEFDGLGRPLHLWPLLPDCVTPEVVNKTLRYRVRLLDGRETVLDQRNLLHIPGLGFDGIRGYSPIWMARQAIGLGMAAEEFGGRFFANSARAGGLIELPTGVKLGSNAAKNIVESYSKETTGTENVGKILAFEQGMKFHQTTIPPDEAQFLETRKFQRSQLFGFYRFPSHMGGDLEHATFSNVEHIRRVYVDDTLVPWAVVWEQEIDRKLFFGQEQERFYVEHLFESLLRGDTKSRMEAHAIAIQNSIETPNEAREAENRNTVDGGDILLQPANEVPLGWRPQPKKEAAASSWGAFLRMLEHQAARLVRKEIASVRAAQQRFGGDRRGFDDWVRDYYSRWATTITDALFSGQHCAGAMRELLEARDVDYVLTKWEKTRAGEVAREELKAIREAEEMLQ